jgi:hypothetical protein
MFYTNFCWPFAGPFMLLAHIHTSAGPSAGPLLALPLALLYKIYTYNLYWVYVLYKFLLALCWPF